MLPIVLVLKKSAYITENAKNASSITVRKARSPIVQDNRQIDFSFSRGGVRGFEPKNNGEISRN
jgi:hypothetical protein